MFKDLFELPDWLKLPEERKERPAIVTFTGHHWFNIYSDLEEVDILTVDGVVSVSNVYLNTLGYRSVYLDARYEQKDVAEELIRLDSLL